MSQTLKIYEQNERILADKLFQLFDTIQDYYFTQGKICYDTVITLKNGTTILGEMKVRNFKADKYPDYILQVDKLLALINKAKNKGHLIYYINFFESETTGMKDFIIFNLSARIPEWKVNKPVVVKKWMNDATFKSTEYKVTKEVIMLQYDETKDMRGSFSIN